MRLARRLARRLGRRCCFCRLDAVLGLAARPLAESSREHTLPGPLPRRGLRPRLRPRLHCCTWRVARLFCGAQPALPLALGFGKGTAGLARAVRLLVALALALAFALIFALAGALARSSGGALAGLPSPLARRLPFAFAALGRALALRRRARALLAMLAVTGGLAGAAQLHLLPSLCAMKTLEITSERFLVQDHSRLLAPPAEQMPA
mmetsp:Transcript_14839/g.58205  ORF Transcript_14839/g.58205 Transcript_14839/m.58205 type:complete len:207 (-) Transcript_14839:54-674(-)